jgi:hypothetical protein
MSRFCRTVKVYGFARVSPASIKEAERAMVEDIQEAGK